ncbi:MAG: hypothetical protein DMG29_16190, partial [Acidobacteria bacterium]
GRRDLLAKKLFHREELYSDFISESARLLVDALAHNLSDPKNLIPAYALLSRMRLSSSPEVLATAEENSVTFVALNSILCKDKYDLEESAEAADAWNGADRYVARLDSRRRCALFFSDQSQSSDPAFNSMVHVTRYSAL